jgi:glycosyltransferase involved in cell wall biosynthesis
METEPKISLVIPVRDEARSIERLLRSIAAQTRLPDEVIFVDAGSNDATRELIESRRDAGLPVKVLSIGPAYPGTARNAGVKEASNDVIAFTDGGIELDKDWLKELSVSMSRGSAVDVVYGNYSPRADTFFKQCLAMATVPPPAPAGGGRMRSRFIASSLLKKPVWQAVGGFPDYRAAEDRIFMERIEGQGYALRFNPRATVLWDIPGNLQGVFGRFSGYSYHDLIAGRTIGWHIPVLKMYAAALACIGLGFAASPVFFALPIAGLALRTVKKIVINRGEPYFRTGYVPLYCIVAGFLIFFIDMAMFAGWLKYLLNGRHPARRKPGTA